MKMNLSAAILAGAVSLATVGGITYALLQPAEPPSPTGQNPSPSSTAQVPVARPTTPAAQTPDSSTPVAPTPGVEAIDQPVPPPAEPPPPSRPDRKVELCAVSMAKVQDPDAPLNVRRAPSTAAEVVGTLANGRWVEVEDEKDGWLQIADPASGWIAKNRTDHGCNRKVERITFQGSGTVSVADRFVGTGNHQYVLPLKQGQRLTLTRGNGPFPAVTAPNGTALVAGPKDDTDRWSGQAAQSGDYTIAMDSNFKGYAYSFLIEVK